MRHLLLPCHWSQRTQIVPDLIKCYGVCGRTIIFSETKNDANELAGALSEVNGARALHGDIPQSQREVRGLWLGSSRAGDAPGSQRVGAGWVSRGRLHHPCTAGRRPLKFCCRPDHWARGFESGAQHRAPSPGTGREHTCTSPSK